jgi:hypothetical protein
MMVAMSDYADTDDRVVAVHVQAHQVHVCRFVPA